MSQGPSWSVAFIHVTLSTRRMFAVTPMRATCSLMTVAMTLNTDFSVLVISSNTSGFCGPYPASASSTFACAGAYGHIDVTATVSGLPGGMMPTQGVAWHLKANLTIAWP